MELFQHTPQIDPTKDPGEADIPGPPTDGIPNPDMDLPQRVGERTHRPERAHSLWPLYSLLIIVLILLGVIVFLVAPMFGQHAVNAPR